MESHQEEIKCPNCNHIQISEVEHTFPWYTYIHHCVNCKYIIMESEWHKIKPINIKSV